jgi:hypothetical protein
MEKVCAKRGSQTRHAVGKCGDRDRLVQLDHSSVASIGSQLNPSGVAAAAAEAALCADWRLAASECGWTHITVSRPCMQGVSSCPKINFHSCACMCAWIHWMGPTAPPAAKARMLTSLQLSLGRSSHVASNNACFTANRVCSMHCKHRRHFSAPYARAT